MWICNDVYYRLVFVQNYFFEYQAKFIYYIQICGDELLCSVWNLLVSVSYFKLVTVWNTI